MSVLPQLCLDRDRECYELIYNVEAYLRMIIRWECFNLQGVAWKGLIPQELRERAEERQREERRIGYLDEWRADILSYLFLGELREIVVGSIWDVFKHQWPSQSILESEFKKLSAIRNKVAHFRPVTARDIRVAARFAEDLADWTSGYRLARGYAKIVTMESTDDEVSDFIAATKILSLAPVWLEWQRKMFEGGGSIQGRKVGRHLGVELALPFGSLEPNRLRDFTTRNCGHYSFLRISELGDKLCCYFPLMNESEERLTSMLDVVCGLALMPGDALSGEECERYYIPAQREGVLPWGVELPAEFRFMRTGHSS